MTFCSYKNNYADKDNTIIGDYMTKLSNRVLVLLIIISIVVVISIFYKKNDKVTTVFNEIDYNKTYIITLDGYGITTKNIEAYLLSEVIAIYPSVCKKYQSIIDSGWYYIDNDISMDKNLDYLNRYYKNLYNKNKLINEAIDIDLNGIVISKIKVVTDNISNYSKYKIEKVNYK